MHHDDQISLWVSPVAVQALIQGPLSHADRKQDRNALAKPPKQFSKRLREAQWSRQKCLSCAGWGRTPRCQQRLVCHKELLLDAAGDIDLACYERTAKLSSGRSATLIALIIAPDAALRGLFILGYQYIYYLTEVQLTGLFNQSLVERLSYTWKFADLHAPWAGGQIETHQQISYRCTATPFCCWYARLEHLMPTPSENCSTHGKRACNSCSVS